MGKILIIVAHDKARGIGRDNKLVWKLPNDMKRFKETTMGSTVIMGRKTFESIGGALRGRTNIVLSRTLPICNDKNVVIERNFEALLGKAQKASGDTFIIGGMEIYGLFLPFVDGILVTEVDGIFDCDTFFPDIPKKDLRIISRVNVFADNENISHTFVEYERRQ